MARPLAFVCQSCGAAHPKWSGRCDDCGAWNTLVEEQAAPPAGASVRRMGKGRPFALEGLSSTGEEPPRRLTRIAEFDRVAGGGLVPGSALLLGGDPGVGKSTLVLQVLAAYAGAKKSAIYISGEEALAQVRLRAARMGLANAPSSSAPPPASRISWRRWLRQHRPTFSSSIPSRPSGPPRSKPRPAPSRRCAPRRMISCATPRRRASP